MHGAVATYQLTGKHLDEARKGAKCDIKNRSKCGKMDFTWPKARKL